VKSGALRSSSRSSASSFVTCLRYQLSKSFGSSSDFSVGESAFCASEFSGSALSSLEALASVVPDEDVSSEGVGDGSLIASIFLFFPA